MRINGETSKAFERRLREGWFYKYLNGRGIDIGCGNDPVRDDCVKWDLELGSGDASVMDGVQCESFDWVYSSHLLEHLIDPVRAVSRWWSLIVEGGFLIIIVPSRDLYEKKSELPSVWNGDHKTFWVPGSSVNAWTMGLLETVMKATNNSADIQSLRVIDDNFWSASTDKHSGGEYSIEIVAKKPFTTAP